MATQNQPKRYILLFGTLAVLSIFALFGLYVHDGYREQEVRARAQTENYAWILDEQAADAFEKFDQTLEELSEHITADDLAIGESGADSSRYENIHRRLQVRVETIPALDIINIHDAQGNLRYTSLPKLPKVNNFDRSYFQKIRQHPDLVRVFSDPLISRSTGKPSLIMARRLLTKDGRFAGTIQANLALEKFENLYGSLHLGEHGVIAMWNEDGDRLVARFPSEHQLIGKAGPVHPLHAYWATGQTHGTVKVVSHVDNEARLATFRKVGNYPYYIIVGMAERDYLKEFKAKSQILLGIVVLFSGVLIYFMGRLNRFQSELQHLNETLAERVDEEVAKNLVHERLLIQQSRFAVMGEMIGNIAHQWRQPLQHLTMIMADIKDAYEFGELNKAYLESSVSKGNLQIQKMASTIDDFREFFRPNKAKFDFSLREAIRDALNLVSASLKDHGITASVEEGEDILASGYPNEFSQVLLNVLNNAKDAVLECAQASPQLSIRLGGNETSCWVTIRDNGGGIAEENLPRIFDPYFTTKEKGTGVGLYMSKMIMEHMEGSIAACNIEGGAEFTVTLPRASQQA